MKTALELLRTSMNLEDSLNEVTITLVQSFQKLFFFRSTLIAGVDIGYLGAYLHVKSMNHISKCAFLKMFAEFKILEVLIINKA